ncbi:hypothetical protein CHUAL_000854 [Chamberlinius hualienensis]
MKPEQEMHVALDEPEIEPWDMFFDLGMLIIEGRTPLPTGRGYGEGPHCQSVSCTSASKSHACDPEDYLCSRQANFRKHMLLLWKANIPMSIEVLVYPDCCPNDQSRELATAGPEPNSILLEKWTVHTSPRRGSEGFLPARTVVQAVRSYLHFSQLSAWYSRTAGKAPKNVIYRVCVPGESFSNKFNEEPEHHMFPVANVSHNNIIKVSVAALHRSSIMPRIICSYHDSSLSFASKKHASLSCESSPKGARKSSPVGACADDREAEGNSRLKHQVVKRCSEGEIMLGDSLLDPPQLLEMYPKRYQSPSRSGSPIMETPEHLMFGSSRNRRGANKLSDSEESPSERGRPWMKKRLDDKCTGDNNGKYCCKLAASETEDEEDLGFSSTKVLLARLKKSAYDFSPEETVQLLMTIRNKQLQLKGSKYDRLLLEKLEKDYKDLSDLLKQIGPKQMDVNQSISQKWGLKKSCVWTKGLGGMPISSLAKEPPSLTATNTQESRMTKSRSCVAECASGGDSEYKYYESVNKNNLALYKGVETGKSTSSAIDEHCNGTGLSDSGAQDSGDNFRKEVPSAIDKAKFRRSLDSAASLVFHSRSGLPLTSSPAPLRKGTCFDFDSSLTSVAAIKHALFEKDGNLNEEEPCKQLSTSAPPCVNSNTNLLGNFEESVLNGRLEPVSTVEGFTAEIGASGSFCPRHILLPVTVFFYKLSDADKVSTPYLGHINLGKKGYLVPKSGTIQVTLFNPHGTVVKMFVAMYDLRDMPPNCQTFLRQRTLYMPVGASDEDPEARSWLRYLVHLRFASSKSGRIYLHTDIRLVVFRKSDMDVTPVPGEATYELRSFTRGPTQPRFSSRK